jgi:hypothetical protein
MVSVNVLKRLVSGPVGLGQFLKFEHGAPCSAIKKGATQTARRQQGKV